MALPDHKMGKKHSLKDATTDWKERVTARNHPEMRFQYLQQHQHRTPRMPVIGTEAGSFPVITRAGMDHDKHGGNNGGGGTSLLVHQPTPCMQVVGLEVGSFPWAGQDRDKHGDNTGAAGGTSLLVRHSTSPAECPPHLHLHNGFADLKATAATRAAGFQPHCDWSEQSKAENYFSYRAQESSLLPQIPEMGPNRGGIIDEGVSVYEAGESVGERCYIQGFPVVSLENGISLSLAMSGRREADPVRSQQPGGAMDRCLQFSNAVPCDVREKRGYATHPRSEAERARRTRISQRIRKLKEVMPIMDKHTNIADVLDMAVDYIKDLQNRAEMLSQNRANCTCGCNGGHQQRAGWRATP